MTEKAGRDASGRFAPGNRVNTVGRPRGSRNAAIVALDMIGEKNGSAVLERVVADALAGDVRSAEIILTRIWPARKGRPVLLPLGEVRSAADIVGAMASVVDGMANGALSPDEAAAVSQVLEAERRAIETAELEARVARLESGPQRGDGLLDQPRQGEP